MALLRVMVGLKILRGGTPSLETIIAWFPDTMNRGNRTENTHPAIICNKIKIEDAKVSFWLLRFTTVSQGNYFCI